MPPPSPQPSAWIAHPNGGAPPPPPALLSLTSLPWPSVTLPPRLSIPPPLTLLLLSSTLLLLLSVAVPYKSLKMPPPAFALLLLTVVPTRLRLASLYMPPP